MGVFFFLSSLLSSPVVVELGGRHREVVSSAISETSKVGEGCLHHRRPLVLLSLLAFRHRSVLLASLRHRRAWHITSQL